ncbi:MAG: ribonuclease III [Actinomycetales bacterium]|nr:ribonuclease III [Actinomycetales bacterium]
MNEKSAEPTLESLQQTLGVRMDADLLSLALTHRSWAYEHGEAPTNERLEFLGDAVLGIIVTDAIFHDYPEAPEGQLARLRAAVVNSKSLADVARALGIGAHIRLGRGEEVTAGHDKPSILADTLEAIIGAVYVDSGFETARAFVRRLMMDHIAIAAELGAGLDWKSSLQELAAERGLAAPAYDIESEGPPHARLFTATVILDGERFGAGTGTSKKEAEQQAAAQAYAALTTR